MPQNFPCYAPIMPSCVPFCSKYAHIRFECSIKVSNGSVNAILGISLCGDCSIRVCQSLTTQVALNLIFTAFAHYSILHQITKAQRLCLLCWCYAQYFGYLACPKLCWHNRSRPIILYKFTTYTCVIHDQCHNI